jgi:hypothetical protein
VRNGIATGYLFDPGSGNFFAKDGTTISNSALQALAATPGQEVTFTSVPPGSGSRIAFGQ